MNTRCTICHDPKRAEIEQARINGETFRGIGKRFDRAKSTVQRHFYEHVPRAAQKALEAANEREIDAGQNVITRLRELTDRTEQQLATAERKRDGRLAVAAIREFRENLKLEAQLLGELGDGMNIMNVQLDPETATRMAEMFLARRSRLAIVAATMPAEAVGSQSITTPQVAEE